MTITVEAGITIQELVSTLAENSQRLPIDVPHAEQATLGGVIATNYSGARRYGFGTMRDYVIGISAVDGLGNLFKSGGRVVKNVAGYDLCKTLVGSLGTIGIITQVTLKVRPQPEASALIVAQPKTLAAAEELLAGLVVSRTAPVAIELLYGQQFGGAWRLIVGFEGSHAEVAWQVETLQAEWQAAPLVEPPAVVADAAQQAAAWQELTDFSLPADDVALLVKFNVPSSKVCDLATRLLGFDASASIQAHAGNGILLAQFRAVPATGACKFLLQQLQPAAAACGGHCTVWMAAQPEEFTRPAWWGVPRGEMVYMQRVKEQFDPQHLLNPGRFIYENE